MNFYHAQNAGRIIAGVTFQIYDITGGSAFGVLKTEDPKLIIDLDSLSNDPRSAVTSISEAEYELCIKKKAPSFGSSNPSKPTSPGAPIKGQGAVVVENADRPEPPVEITGQVETVDEALKVGEVKPAEGQKEPTPPARDGRTEARKAKAKSKSKE
jgi:hypothetical protein